MDARISRAEDKVTSCETSYFSTYNDLPYLSYPIEATSPERLSALGYLMGLKTAPIDQCRVLEVGCGSGGNIIPLAAYHPQSHYVGIDASSVHIDQALRQVAELGLTNVQFHCADIADFNDWPGSFDYIIAHGIYSWVPKEVQQAILGVCSRRLAPQGISYVSYNCLSGWHFKLALRGILKQHADRRASPSAQVRDALQLLNRLCREAEERGSRHLSALVAEKERWESHPTSYLFHEFLGEINSPCFVDEFVRRASQAGLQHLMDADPPYLARGPQFDRNRDQLSPQARLGNEREHDDRFSRTFRKTLLVSDRLVLDPRRMGTRVLDLFVSGDVAPTPGQDLETSAAIEFRTRSYQLKSEDRMLNRVLHHIGGQWPKRIAVAEMADLLCDHYSRRSRRSAVSAIAFIGVRLPMVILRGVAGGFLSLYRSPLKYPVSLSKRPETSPLVRMQARWGNKVSSWLHYAVKLSPFERALVDKLDGAQDLNALVRRVIEEPEPKSHRNGDAPALNDQATPDEVRELVVRSLQRFLKCGLLVG